MLNIEWRQGPEYPMGIQDSAIGVLHGELVSAGGFTRHPKDIAALHPDAFGGERSGFTRLTFALDPGNERRGWQRIADVPGAPRQGAAAAVVGDALYITGGFNYSSPHTYCDTHRLVQKAGAWRWESLPACDLPWPVCEAGTAVIGSKIYLVGGSDFFRPPDAGQEDFHSEAGRDGSTVGSALLVLDTENLEAGWKTLAQKPGTAQCMCASAAAAGKIHVLGGIFAPLNPQGGPPYYNAVDSWIYDPENDQWSDLPDAPAGSNRRAAAFNDRYVILVGGYKYAQTWNVDGTRTDVYTPQEKTLDWTAHFEDQVLVFDTETGRLGAAHPLLERTSGPMVAISGSTIYSLGGEGGPRLWHPATLQIGKVIGP